MAVRRSTPPPLPPRPARHAHPAPVADDQTTPNRFPIWVLIAGIGGLVFSLLLVITVLAVMLFLAGRETPDRTNYQPLPPSETPPTTEKESEAEREESDENRSESDGAEDRTGQERADGQGQGQDGQADAGSGGSEGSGERARPRGQPGSDAGRAEDEEGGGAPSGGGREGEGPADGGDPSSPSQGDHGGTGAHQERGGNEGGGNGDRPPGAVVDGSGDADGAHGSGADDDQTGGTGGRRGSGGSAEDGTGTGDSGGDRDQNEGGNRRGRRRRGTGDAAGEGAGGTDSDSNGSGDDPSGEGSGGSIHHDKPLPKEKTPRQASHFFGITAPGKRFLYLLEVSENVSGDVLARVADELMASLEKLSDEQEVLVMLYSDDCYPMFFPSIRREPVACTDALRAEIRQWLSEFEIGGAPHPLPALEFALSTKSDALFFLTSESLPDDATRAIKKANVHRVPIHILSFENRSAEESLRRIAEDSGGSWHFVE